MVVGHGRGHAAGKGNKGRQQGGQAMGVGKAMNGGEGILPIPPACLPHLPSPVLLKPFPKLAAALPETCFPRKAQSATPNPPAPAQPTSAT